MRDERVPNVNQNRKTQFLDQVYEVNNAFLLKIDRNREGEGVKKKDRKREMCS